MQSYTDGTKDLKSSRKTTDSIVSIQPLGVNAPSPTYSKVHTKLKSLAFFPPKTAVELAWAKLC